MTLRSGKLIVRMIIIGMLIQLLFIAYVFYQSYEGRVTLVNAQRAGCVRGNQDRRANARGWRIAEKARRADGQFVVADNYKKIAEKLEAHGRIPCVEAYPKPGFIP